MVSSELLLATMSSTDIEGKGVEPYVCDGDLSDEPELPPSLQAIAQKGFLGTLRHYERLLDKCGNCGNHVFANM